MTRQLPLIRKSPLFSHLSEGELKALVGVGQVGTVPAGERIAREGDITDELVMLLSGSVHRTSADQPDGERSEAADEPVLLGYVGLLRDTPRNASVTTETPCTLFWLPRRRFDELVESGHVGAYKLAVAVGRDLAERVCSLTEGLRTVCQCCQKEDREEELAHFRKQLVTEWNL